jgi:hypothetical protein
VIQKTNALVLASSGYALVKMADVQSSINLSSWGNPSDPTQFANKKNLHWKHGCLGDWNSRARRNCFRAHKIAQVRLRFVGHTEAGNTKHFAVHF